MSVQSRAEDLMARGFKCIKEDDFTDAIRIGKELKDLRHSSAFEILAVAYAGQDKVKKAVSILEEGVLKAPSIWRLWQLLGNHRSDLGDFDGCYDAYRKAMECEGVDASSVHLNFAIALDRQQRYAEAIEHLDRVVDENLALRAAATRLSVLNHQGRHDDVVRLAALLLDSPARDEDGEQRAEIETELGVAIWKSKKDTKAALDHAWCALGLSRGLSQALWLVREIDGRVSRSAKYCRVLVQGKWHEPLEDVGDAGFIASYDVVAESAEQALEFARLLEPPAVRASMKIEEYSELEHSPDQPMGVYTCTGHTLYPIEKAE